MISTAWHFITTNYGAIGIIIAALSLIGGLIRFFIKLRNDKAVPVPMVGGGEISDSQVVMGHNINATSTHMHGIDPQAYIDLAKQFGITEAKYATILRILEQNNISPEELNEKLPTLVPANKGGGVTLAQLMELFIALGIIAPDKAWQARAVAAHQVLP